MKKIILAVLILVILIAVIVYHQNTKVSDIISFLEKKGKEEIGDLHYKVNLMGLIPVATVTFKKEAIQEFKGERFLQLSAKAESLKAFSSLFQGSVVLSSYIDMATNNPMLFSQQTIISGKERERKELIYDQKNGVMIYEGVKRQIPLDTQDPLSIIFKIRQMNLEKVDELEMYINSNQKNYRVKGRVTAKDILIKKNKVRLYTLEATIARSDKNPYHRSKIKIVFLARLKNLPVLMQVFSSGFLVNVKLTDIK